MSRVSPKLANTVSFVRPARGKAKNRWVVNFYDSKGVRKTVTVDAESKAVATSIAKKLSYQTIPKRRNKYLSKDLNAVIDEALKDFRITPERAEELKALNLPDRRRDTKHLSKIVGGKPVYKPRKLTVWGNLPFKIKGNRDLVNLQDRVSLKLRNAKKIGADVHKELLGEMEKIGKLKNPSELFDWEEIFNNKYDVLSGQWKTVSANYINKTPEVWARENIKAHAKREFLRAGFDLPAAIKKTTEYVNSISESELAEWHKTLFPIKKYNDSVYKLALANGDPAALKGILAVHHIQPVGYEGSVRDPRNVVGIEGGQYKMELGSDHASIHDALYNTHYYDLMKQNVTVGEFAPPGSKGSPVRLFDASGELMPADQWIRGLNVGASPESRAIFQRMDIDKYNQLQKIDFADLLKNNPKKAIMISALLPFMFGYSASGAAQDEVPPEFLNVPKQDRFFANPEIDNMWQAAKYHTYKKEGSALEWANVFDYTDLGFYGKGQRKYNMNLKNAEERKMVDPTWKGTGLPETIGDKSTILDRRPEFWNRKRESIWT